MQTDECAGVAVHCNERKLAAKNVQVLLKSPANVALQVLSEVAEPCRCPWLGFANLTPVGARVHLLST